MNLVMEPSVYCFPPITQLEIRTGEGVEFLIHIGIDTVTLNGEGFKPLVAADDRS